MAKANQDVKDRATEKGVALWEVAHVYGINDGNFSRKLRFELTDEEKQRLFSIIDEIAEGRS